MNKGEIATRVQVTGRLLIRPTTETGSGFINCGDVAGHKRPVKREGAKVQVADKGFQRQINDLTTLVGWEYEFTLREQFGLIIPMLIASGAAISASSPSGTGSTASFSAVKPGCSYLLGRTDLSAVAVAVGVTPMTAGADFVADMGSGEIYIVPGGAILDGDNITVTFSCPTTSFQGFTGLAEAQYKTGAVRIFEFDQHATAGVQRRQTAFNGQYWFEGSEDQDAKKPAELVLKVLAIDKPSIQWLKT